MASQSTFQIMFDSLISSLQASNKVVEVSNNFFLNKDLKSMFKFVWDLDLVHDYIEISKISQKDDEKAESLRKSGNKFYVNKLLIKALQCYNASIMQSPQNITESLNELLKEDTKNIGKTSSVNLDLRNLALGYANRSAVLFELQNYNDCLRDISKSISYGYPLLLRSKLAERQAKCYLALNEVTKAKETLSEGIINLKQIDLEEEKVSSSIRSLETLLNNCDSWKEENISDNSKNKKYKHLFGIEKALPPELSNPNQEIPSLSSAVQLSYLPEKGRFLTASRDIMPGETLIKETGFSNILLPTYMTSHCCYCFQTTYTPLPCPSCSSVVFCSEECCSEALIQFHGIECCILPMLIALDLGRNAMLALRLVIQVSLPGLKQKIVQMTNAKQDPQHLGFNEQGIYSSEDYASIYNFVSNAEQRSMSDMFKRGVMAVCLVKLLLRSKYFGSDVEDSSCKNLNSSTTQDIHFVGQVLFTHLMNLPCNAHSITELQVNTENYQESPIEEIGAGAFAVLSLTNHSCNPSLSRSCYGATLVAKSITFIPKGAEVADSYGEHYAIRGKAERQNYLHMQYYFTCSCEACTHDWPVYSSTPKAILLSCPKCSSSIPLGAKQCKKCETVTSNLNLSDNSEYPNFEALFAEMKEAVNLYNISYERVLKGFISEENSKNITRVIFLLNKYALLPNRLLFEAQETLKHCFYGRASHFGITPNL